MREYRRGERIDDRWLVLRVLQGGLGRVYIVFDLSDQIPLALKTFQVEQADAEFIERFRQEASTWILAGNHPNIVRAHYYLPLNDELYLFLEYVDGGDLSDWIGTSRLADVRTVLELSLQFCDGMAHAASQGVSVHRDIKPQNCMLTGGGVLKITDFGLAKASDSRVVKDSAALDWIRAVQSGRNPPPPQGIHLTGQGKMMGTATHMAPEQFEDFASVDVRADIYSFGIMLFQMLTGRLPFLGESVFQMFYLHARQEPPKTGNNGFDAIIGACLAKRPEERPKDFSQVRAMLSKLYSSCFGKEAPSPAPARDYEALEQQSRALALLNLGYPDRALKLLSQAAEQRPDIRSLWTTLGHSYNQTGHPEKARPCLAKALEFEQDASTWVELGLSCELLAQPAQAEKAYHRALELNPKYAGGFYSLGGVLAGQGRLRESLAAFRRAVELAPEMGMYRVGFGMALMNARLFPEASAAFLDCLQRDSTHSRAWYYLAVCQKAMKDHAGAEKSYRKALTLEPNNVKFWTGLAKFFQDTGQPDKASDCFEQARHEFPNSHEIQEETGLFFLKQGRTEEGMACLNAAAQLGSPSAKSVLATLRRGM